MRIVFGFWLGMVAAFVVSVTVTAQDIESDPAMVEAVARVQAVRDSLNGSLAVVTKAFVDSIVTADSLDAVGPAGVVTVADTKDASWVQIDVPLSSSTGMALTFWKGWMASAPDLFGAQVTKTPGRVRMNKGNALEALRALNEVLK